jgi:hypothetical protein
MIQIVHLVAKGRQSRWYCRRGRCDVSFGIVEVWAMQSKDCHGSHLRVSLSRMKMVDGDNAGERGVMVVMGHGLCVSLCVWRDRNNKVGPEKISALEDTEQRPRDDMNGAQTTSEGLWGIHNQGCTQTVCLAVRSQGANEIKGFTCGRGTTTHTHVWPKRGIGAQTNLTSSCRRSSRNLSLFLAK